MKKQYFLMVLTLLLLSMFCVSCTIPKQYDKKIVLFNDDGSIYETMSFTNFNGTLPSPEKEGFNFLGWYLNGKKLDIDKLVIKNLKDNLYLIAQWEVILEEPSFKRITFIIGDSINNFTFTNDFPPDWQFEPEVDGYIFDGWFIGENRFQFGIDEVTNNLVLTARFYRMYQVKFLDNNEVIKEVLVKENEFALPEPRESTNYHEFIGWYLEDELFDFENSKIIVNIELVAKYIDYHKVSYYDGDNVFDEIWVQDNHYIEPLKISYEKENLIFSGWDYEGKPFDFENTQVTSDIILYANWQKNLETVVNELIVELSNLIIPHLYSDEDLITVNLIINEGINEIRYASSLEEVHSLYQSVIERFNLVPTYLTKLDDWNDNLNKNDYFDDEWLAIKAIYEDAWSDIFYYKGGVPTVERIYQEAIKSINNIVTKADDIENAKYLKTIKIRQLTNFVDSLNAFDYSAKDWQLLLELKNAGKMAISEAVGTKEVASTYAFYVNAISAIELNERIHYTINYIVDGSVYQSFEIIEGDLVTCINAPVKEGYQFVGWYFENELYDFNTQVTKNITLVAHYEKEFIQMFSVIFIVNDMVYDVKEVEIGSIVKAPVEPLIEGLIFLGWYLENQLYYFYTPVTSNLELIAQFKEENALPQIPDLPINESDFVIFEGIFLSYIGNDTEILIPASVERIGGNAFSGTNVNYVWFENGSMLTEVMDNAFSNSNVIGVYFHNTNLYRICNNAFFSCLELKEVYFSDSLTELGDDIFAECLNLEYLYIENTNILTLSTHLLMNNNALTSIILPASLTTVRSAFACCCNLISITLLSQVPPMMEGEFLEGGWNPGLIIYVPVGCLDAYLNTSGWQELSHCGIMFMEISN